MKKQLSKILDLENLEIFSKLKFIARTPIVVFLVSVLCCVVFVIPGLTFARGYYFTFDSALMWNAICNTALTIWGLIVAVYLHREIIEKEYSDSLINKFGKFFGNLIRPTVSIVLVISSAMLLMTFFVIKLTELRIDELTKLTTQ